ncbi:MAG: hypothetical protein ACFFG0_04285 [Candidatus Thorarchaeota archaeon]
MSIYISRTGSYEDLLLKFDEYYEDKWIHREDYTKEDLKEISRNLIKLYNKIRTVYDRECRRRWSKPEYYNKDVYRRGQVEEFRDWVKEHTKSWNERLKERWNNLGNADTDDMSPAGTVDVTEGSGVGCTLC